MTQVTSSSNWQTWAQSHPQQAIAVTTPKLNKYIPHYPTERQTVFLLCNHVLEVLYGGSAGGGKSESLLMAALQYVDIPGYHALLLRRTYADLSLPEAIMHRAEEWLMPTDARWNGNEKTWTFPSGATVTFGYLQSEADKYRYQSSAFQFCTVADTPVLMSDDTYKPVQELRVGDCVQTLTGIRKITRIAKPRLASCVEAQVFDATGKLIGSQNHSTNHRVLTPDGWVSYDDMIYASHLCGFSLSMQSHYLRKSAWRQTQKYLSVLRMFLYPECCLEPRCVPSQLPMGQMDCEGSAEFPVGAETDCVKSGDLCLDELTLVPLSYPVVLLKHPHRSDNAVLPHSALHYEGGYVQGKTLVEDSQFGYQSLSHLYDERIHPVSAFAQDEFPLLSDAVESSGNFHNEDSRFLQKHTLSHSISFAHPYTMDKGYSAYGSYEVGSCAILPIGKRFVYGITVESDNHYITQSGLVQANCGFDELTQFTETQYTYLFSRLRRLANSNVPLRMRTASNPGGVGHEWVKARFLSGNTPKRIFVPAKLDDNPYIDKDEYLRSLSELDIVTRARLEDGNWDMNESGGIFKREWFPLVDYLPPANEFKTWVRYWDLAGSEPSNAYPDPDYTVGLKMGLHRSGKLYITDIQRFRKTSADVEKEIVATASVDGRGVEIGMEQEGGSAGKSVIDHYRMKVLIGYTFRGYKSTGSKIDRARPASPRAEAKDICLVRAAWNEDFLQEINAFTGDGKLHDDQVDTLSGAYEMLATSEPVKAQTIRYA